jgi:hypothetical protein
MRRGIPATPRKCIGKKVTLKPIIISQKVQWPSVSFSIVPVNFGHQ